MIGKIEDLIAYRLKKEKLIRLKKQSLIEVKNQKYKIRIYENLLDGSEHFALIKGKIKKGITPRVRVISSNVVKNYLINHEIKRHSQCQLKPKKELLPVYQLKTGQEQSK